MTSVTLLEKAPRGLPRRAVLRSLYRFLRLRRRARARLALALSDQHAGSQARNQARSGSRRA